MIGLLAAKALAEDKRQLLIVMGAKGDLEFPSERLSGEPMSAPRPVPRPDFAMPISCGWRCGLASVLVGIQAKFLGSCHRCLTTIHGQTQNVFLARRCCLLDGPGDLPLPHH